MGLLHWEGKGARGGETRPDTGPDCGRATLPSMAQATWILLHIVVLFFSIPPGSMEPVAHVRAWRKLSDHLSCMLHIRCFPQDEDCMDYMDTAPQMPL